MSALNNSALIGASGSTGYQISRSVRLRSSASAYFNRTAGATASNQNIATLSCWLKRGTLGANQRVFESYTASTDAGTGCLEFTSSDTLAFTGFATNWRITTQVLRDPSAWYHIVIAIDTTQATAGNRIRIYINGAEVTAFGTSNNPTQNTTVGFNNNSAVQQIGRRRIVSNNDLFFDGYLTEINFIDGQALTPASFGETNAVTGVWQPKKYTGTYGTNGFYLNFSDPSAATAAAIGKDYSGNGNNWTPNNISVTAGATYDSMLDVPTPWADGGNGRGNYPTLNAVDGGIARTTISNANLSALFTGVAAGAGIRSSGFQMPTTGKWYAEFTLVAKPLLANASSVGISRVDTILNPTGNWYIGNGANDYAWIWYTGTTVRYNNATLGAAYGTAPAVGDVIGVAVDLDTNPGAFTLTFHLNGVSQGAAYTNQSAGGQTFAFACSGTNNTDFAANFGQRPFAYTPPTGFKALNTLNLPTPTIANGANYFAATTYTGNGSTQSISNAVNGVSFQPDLFWAKRRNLTASHALFDSIRGANSALYPNLTNAEDNAWTGQAFVSNGFTVSAAYSGETNANTGTFVGWQWKEGATQGFDIVTYTGNGTTNQSISHSLGVAPQFIIVKRRNAVDSWPVYHASATSINQFLVLNSTAAVTATTNSWGTSAPNSSVFNVGSTAGSATNVSGGTYVAYLFAEVAGFSRFGSYTGNGSADGPFIFTGFRPAFVLIKQSDAVRGWNIEDTSRNTFNAMNSVLAPQASSAESTNAAWSVDALSNGFKIRTSDTAFNASGGTYIFAAFSEVGFKYALGR